LVFSLFIILAGCGNDSRGNYPDKPVAKAVSVSELNSFILISNGRVYAAGSNDYGELGMGDNINRNVFTEVTDLRDKNITAIVGGSFHSLALSSDGKVYAAGGGGNGQPGFGKYDSRNVFTEVPIP
jgi:alpha-tubulin suppressor-like RCC1 family protein